MINLNQTLTLKQVIDICKKYDCNGANRFPESEFEGASVGQSIIEEVSGEELNSEQLNQIFNY